MTASKIEMGYLLGVSHVGTHTASCISPTDCGAVIFIIIFFFFFDGSPELQIFSCSPLVILHRRRSDVYYFPAAGRIIYEGKPRRLPAGFKQEAGLRRY